MSSLAIMQPYFFPYLGYWQLIEAVDRFVIYDDVNYIKGGWVNRNRLLINGEPVYLTVPLRQASPYRRICETALDPSPRWRDRMVRTVDTTYRKAPYFCQVFPVLEKLIRAEAEWLSDYLAQQLKALAAFMGSRAEFVGSSQRYDNRHLAGPERVLDICRREGVRTYVNPPGGRALYEGQTFRRAGLDLRFIAMDTLPYPQRAAGFVPHLSIIDALMALGPAGIRRHLQAFRLDGAPTCQAHA